MRSISGNITNTGREWGLGFGFKKKSREKNLLIPAAAGFSPSMQHLVFWPHAGAWGAGVILPPCARILWCELYVMKSTKKKKKLRAVECYYTKYALMQGGGQLAATVRIA